MALVLADRVKETTTSSGTGSLTLLGAVNGFDAVSEKLATNDTSYFACVHRTADEWEVFLGTLTSSSTLARTTVIASSNGGSAVSFTTGTKDVFISLPASIIEQLLSDVAGKAAASHTHAIADVTGLQAALDAKAASSHTHTASQVTDFSEAVDDRVGSLLVAGTNVTLTYNDGSNTLTIDAAGGGGGGVDEHQAALVAAVFN